VLTFKPSPVLKQGLGGGGAGGGAGGAGGVSRPMLAPDAETERGAATTAPPAAGKAYYKIGEVARLVGVPQHVLRYWETEFPAIRPDKSRSGQRVYRAQDVELLRLVRRLLRDEGLTIAGARRRLREAGRSGAAPAGEGPVAATATATTTETAALDSGRDAARSRRVLARVRREIEDLVRLVDADQARAPEAE
jgi:DNA-binding transcriptional MerR regulator